MRSDYCQPSVNARAHPRRRSAESRVDDGRIAADHLVVRARIDEQPAREHRGGGAPLRDVGDAYDRLDRTAAPMIVRAGSRSPRGRCVRPPPIELEVRRVTRCGRIARCLEATTPPGDRGQSKGEFLRSKVPGVLQYAGRRTSRENPMEIGRRSGDPVRDPGLDRCPRRRGHAPGELISGLRPDPTSRAAARRCLTATLMPRGLRVTAKVGSDRLGLSGARVMTAGGRLTCRISTPSLRAGLHGPLVAAQERQGRARSAARRREPRSGSRRGHWIGRKPPP